MLRNLWVVAMAVFVLAACGGAGSDPSLQPAAVAAPEAPAVDVLFSNVPTESLKKSAIPGEHMEAAAFRVEGRSIPIEQLIFTSKSTKSLSAALKKVRLISSTGNDVGGEAPYNVRFDDEHNQVVLDFLYQWVPVDTGVVPTTYSLMVALDPAVKTGTTLAFELTAVQTHDYGRTVALEVKGGVLKVEPIADKDLPVAATESPASFTTTSEIGGAAVPVGSFKVSCPEKNKTECVLESVKYYACGMSDPMLGVDGMTFWAYRWGGYPDDYYTFNANSVGYAVPQGETKVFTIFATPLSKNLQINVIEMVWTVGGSTKVSPLVSASSVSGGLLETEKKACKEEYGKG